MSFEPRAYNKIKIVSLEWQQNNVWDDSNIHSEKQLKDIKIQFHLYKNLIKYTCSSSYLHSKLMFNLSHTSMVKIHREYLLFWGEYQIYFIECGEKIIIFHECVARVKMLIFSPHEMKYVLYLPRKSKFSFYFILNGNTEITTLLFTWSFLVRFDFCSVFIEYNIGCNHILTNETQEISI